MPGDGTDLLGTLRRGCARVIVITRTVAIGCASVAAGGSATASRGGLLQDARQGPRARCHDLAPLKAREQRDLTLQAVGYPCEQIATVTNSSHTAPTAASPGPPHLRRLAADRARRP